MDKKRAREGSSLRLQRFPLFRGRVALALSLSYRRMILCGDGRTRTPDLWLAPALWTNQLSYIPVNGAPDARRLVWRDRSSQGINLVHRVWCRTRHPSQLRKHSDLELPVQKLEPQDVRDSPTSRLNTGRSQALSYWGVKCSSQKWQVRKKLSKLSPIVRDHADGHELSTIRRVRFKDELVLDTVLEEIPADVLQVLFVSSDESDGESPRAQVSWRRLSGGVDQLSGLRPSGKI